MVAMRSGKWRASFSKAAKKHSVTESNATGSATIIEQAEGGTPLSTEQRKHLALAFVLERVGHGVQPRLEVAHALLQLRHPYTPAGLVPCHWR